MCVLITQLSQILITEIINKWLFHICIVFLFLFFQQESIDVEKMDVDEGEKVDAALGKAFATVRSIRSNKDKKQIAADRSLTYFRLRYIETVLYFFF